jgi:hypothetical protein
VFSAPAQRFDSKNLAVGFLSGLNLQEMNLCRASSLTLASAPSKNAKKKKGVSRRAPHVRRLSIPPCTKTIDMQIMSNILDCGRARRALENNKALPFFVAFVLDKSRSLGFA